MWGKSALGYGHQSMKASICALLRVYELCLVYVELQQLYKMSPLKYLQICVNRYCISCEICEMPISQHNCSLDRGANRLVSLGHA